MSDFTAMFENDGYTLIKLPGCSKSEKFASRMHHEPLFRRFCYWMMKNGIIDCHKNIIDLGAWIGDNSLIWAKNIASTPLASTPLASTPLASTPLASLVYAIDPSENNCNFMRALAEFNSIENIVIIQKAISDGENLVTTNDDIDHCSFVYDNVGETGVTKLTSTSLDKLYETGVITNIGFIHLDVEGMEFQVLTGAERIITKFRPVIAYEQHFELDDVMKIVNLLKEHGYINFIINEILPGCRPDCRNLLAFPNEVPVSVFEAMCASAKVNPSVILKII